MAHKSRLISSLIKSPNDRTIGEKFRFPNLCMYPYSRPVPNEPACGQYFGRPQYVIGQASGQYGSPSAQYSQQSPVFTQPTRYYDSNSPLDPLIGVDKVIVKQKKEMLEIFSGWETNNRYEIYDGHGRVIYYAFEDSSAWSRCCLGRNRPFCIRVINLQGRQIMVLNSSINCCTREVAVQVPEGRLISNIFRECACSTPSLFVNDAAGTMMFKIKTPLRAILCSFSDVKFDVLSSDQRTVVGQISKEWGGFFREWLTDADTFGVSFPPDMDPTWKAVLLAATFVVDFEYYETSD